MDNMYAVIGPPASGKTSVVGSLQVAARNATGSLNGFAGLDVVPMTSATAELFAMFASTMQADDGTLPIPASEVLVKHRFMLTLATRRLLLWNHQQSTEFQVLDAPGGVTGGPGTHDAGGDVDHTLIEEYRTAMLAALTTASGFIVCVDSTDEEAAGWFFTHLAPFLDRVQRDREP